MNNIQALFILVFLSLNGFCQKNLLLVDKNKNTLALQKITIGTRDYLSNTMGLIELDSSEVSMINPLTYIVSPDTITWNKTDPIPKISFTSLKDRRIIRSVIRNSRNLSLKSLAPFEYDSYNKFIIHSSKIQQSENLLNNLLKRFNRKEILPGNEKRHVVFSESMSKRKYLDLLHGSETVQWSKISGVENPLFLSINSQLQTIDVVGKHIDMIGTHYVNPFHKSSSIGYHFSLSDSMVLNGETIIKVNFNPKKYTRFEALKGYAWINTTDKSIIGISCVPNYGRKTQKTYSIQMQKQDGKYIPKEVTSSIILNNISSSDIQIKAIQHTSINNFKTSPTLIKEQFSDLAITYRKQQPDSIIRPFKLNELEQNTYNYFSKGKNLKLNQPLKWGEQLYFGDFHTKHFNIYLPSLLSYNRHERLRTGIKLSTNDLLSNKVKLSSYFAYGWSDKALKGGFNAEVKLLKDDLLDFSLDLKNDLEESGTTTKTLTKPFYNSEFLRDFQQNIFDQQVGATLSLSSKPLNYLSTQLSYKTFKDIPKYDYNYLPNDGQKFREVRLDARYAYGERFYRFYDHRISLKTIYPIVWVHLEKSLPNSDFDYTRVQFRARYTHKFSMNGTSKVEFLSGKYWGELPYFKLFNGLGSERLKSLAKGAFETMEYNEFAADNYFIMFYSHDFGFFNFSKNKTFRPHIEVAVNFGLGRLKDENLHEGLEVKSFDKGFGEIGLSINELLLLYPAGIKIGVGVSFFHRALNYRLPTFRANSALKLTTNFVF